MMGVVVELAEEDECNTVVQYLYIAFFICCFLLCTFMQFCTPPWSSQLLVGQCVLLQQVDMTTT